jgi:hypothetical protein
MQPRKAVIIDVPIRKFMNERPVDRVIVRSGDRTIENQSGEALVTAAGGLALAGERPHPISPTSGEIRVGQPQGAVCTRRRANGAICGRPADGGHDECWLHAEWYSLLPAVFGMPYPEDATAIHQILARTMSMVISGEMSPQKAQAVTKLCRELRRNLMWYQRETGVW